MSEDKKNIWNKWLVWKKWADVKIRVCCWNKCKERMSQYTLDRACRELNLEEWTFEDWWTTENWKVQVEKTWCMWNCRDWVNVKIEKKWKNWKTEQMISRVDPIKMWNLMNEFKKFKNKK